VAMAMADLRYGGPEPRKHTLVHCCGNMLRWLPVC